MSLGIRGAEVGDAEAIARLNKQLGRGNGEGEIVGSLKRLLVSDRDFILVAESPAGVIGWIHAAVREALGSGCRCEILGLVVDQEYRGRGSGRLLVAEAEVWARDRGLAEVLVRSNVVRRASHPFYERLGYALSKTQHVYRKPVRSEVLSTSAP